jgi:hypothetical protein
MAMIRKLHKGLGISADILIEDAPRIESKLMIHNFAASA